MAWAEGEAGSRIWDDAFLDALEPRLAFFRDTAERRQAQALIKAVRLAPRLTVCEALLRHEHVPRSMLDAEWATAYGM